MKTEGIHVKAIAIAMLATLCACGTSPESNYYLLTPSVSESSAGEARGGATRGGVVVGALGLDQLGSTLFYYHPGWWEPGPSLEVEMSLAQWNELPEVYQAAVERLLRAKAQAAS